MSRQASKKQKRPALNRAGLLCGSALIAIGIAIGAYSLIATWLAQRSYANSGPALVSSSIPRDTNPLMEGTPTHITIPSVNIDLEIIPGYYTPSNKSWTLTRDKAQWGTMTAKANNKEGSTFIYAHNRVGVFHTLPKIQLGAEVIINTDNNHLFTYKFVNSTVTSPSDTSLFSYEGKPVLVLQTCTGLWYQDRQLFMFDLVRAE